MHPGERAALRVGAGQLGSDHERRQVASALPARRAAAAGQHPVRRDEPRRPAAAPDLQSGGLPGANRVLRPAVDGPARRHRLGAGALRLRQQHRRRNREDAVRPVLHQEPIAAPRPRHPSQDRRHRAARVRHRPPCSGRFAAALPFNPCQAANENNRTRRLRVPRMPGQPRPSGSREAGRGNSGRPPDLRRLQSLICDYRRRPAVRPR